jgi:hypothetical protein
VDHRADAHQEQPLVEDVRERVRGRAGDGELGADADRRDHETDLADDVVAEQPADVVLEDGVGDAVEGHRDADPDQDLPAGEAAGQGVDGGLGGVGREEHRAGDGRLGVGVRQPGVQRRDGGRHRAGQEDQHARRRDPERLERERPGVGVVPQRPGEQQLAAEDVDEQVAHPGASAVATSPLQDEEGAGDRLDLPGHEEGQQVAGEDDRHRRRGVDEGRGAFAGRLGPQAVGRGDHRDEAEDHRERAAELVVAQHLDVEAEPGPGDRRAEVELGQLQQGDQRRGDDQDAADPDGHDEAERRGHQQRQRGVQEEVTHGGPPARRRGRPRGSSPRPLDERATEPLAPNTSAAPPSRPSVAAYPGYSE